MKEPRNTLDGNQAIVQAEASRSMEHEVDLPLSLRTWCDPAVGARLSNRAADEIERLRTALEQKRPKRAYYETHDPPHCPTCGCGADSASGEPR